MYIEKLFTKYKSFCLQLEFYRPHFDTFLYFKTILFNVEYYFDFYINLLSLVFINLFWSKKIDHAGLTIEVYLFGVYFILYVNDIRHWDYENDKWVSYE